MAEVKYLYGLGRRKSATASVRLTPGKGRITINDQPASEYLSGNKTVVAKITDPLALVSKQKDFDITVVVKGGGVTGQVDAIRLAIAKALVVGFSDLRTILKKAEFLKRDSREKERKKYGLRSARKREQFSKR
ncbi:30S ribosomal protein S9 [Candidatus Saccharibacteria bacterium CG11_big_fil_rev_8_21_14_0_20_41_19]|nr:30S ribosomal protein S9 [Candidatus Saccharibacteria bacterium]OIP86267.1 MAG: 30S ribosomal protein S9 [Candidatus Saccharibacteria bacterium CG2_30_41_52]PIQ71081.1 MAG: 30S ribosomal protein S9 [Candidatus Saccharibacteria bacterium CG11_big_fil_rev_8_21_14_0_20_41_19]PIZ59385.1 MAG: 30S ribosomal protein S9 [Candidatus Saccharibacteria bacterium CG_4_10_14_0_2_um_filter_41_11]PJC29500.1 MAG: 30S ribosomal protein S9 [Candidatus Saccharibacteria bacterium CG_4_9_14_0_2_um_filter_41_9]PJ